MVMKIKKAIRRLQNAILGHLWLLPIVILIGSVILRVTQPETYANLQDSVFAIIMLVSTLMIIYSIISLGTMVRDGFGTKNWVDGILLSIDIVLSLRKLFVSPKMSAYAENSKYWMERIVKRLVQPGISPPPVSRELPVGV